MAEWYVKDLSKLTGVSVQTLHHYDRIDLLKPSVRLSNGYRIYSENDLLKLQQIIALKFFGFELAQIKILLAADVDMLDNFSVQSQFLEEKAKTLFEASKVLKSIISNCRRDKSIPWETIIQLIEVYRMTQQLEKTWVGKALNADELKKYAKFQQELQTRCTEREIQALKQEWSNLVCEIDSNLDKDPSSDFGVELGRRCMSWGHNMYGKDNVALKLAVWEKGFKSGLMPDSAALSLDGISWLEKAIYAYHTVRIRGILKQAEGDPTGSAVLDLWEELLTDMYGNDYALRDGLIKEIMKNEKVSQAAKSWLKRISRS